MKEASYFQSTRGRIVEALQRRGARTAAELAAEQGLTANAVRRHLAHLERDGLIAQLRERRSRTKPTYVYSLTSRGQDLFPQRYQVLLNAVLDQLGREADPQSLSDIFRKIGERTALKQRSRFAGKTTAHKVAEMAKLLGEQGVMTEWHASPGGFVLREHNCPYKDAARSHPQVCGIVHALIEQTLCAAPDQRSSIARGDAVCEFHIPAGVSAADLGGH